ncbi:MAG: hypothetical protein WKF84_17960 [Pyrinomonadaceae bacterium]
MKTCPWCHHQFEDALTVCPHDGENLTAVARQPVRIEEFGQESHGVAANDEENVNVKQLRNVRASPETELQSDSQAVPLDQTTAPLSTFNPWKIAVPALIVLFVCFGVFYAVQPRAGVDVTPALPTDPLSTPAQSLPPATGESERELTIRQEQPANANISPIVPPNNTASVDAECFRLSQDKHFRRERMLR